jgi:hypothetical protein
MMTCNGKTYPLFTTCNFDLVLFGSSAKGKVNVKAEFNKDDNQWSINQMHLITKEGKKPIY